MPLVNLAKFWFPASGPFWGLFGPKVTDSCNCISTLKIILKFCIMKGGKRYFKATLLVLLKKIGFGQVAC